jgi:hypothetical protein
VDRTGRLKIVYQIALATFWVLAVWGVVFDVPVLFGRGQHLPRAQLVLMLSVSSVFAAAGFAVGLAALVFLTVRPMGWGKLLLLLAALSWIGHGLAGLYLGIGNPVEFSVPIAAGAIMLCLAIAHQVIDLTSRPTPS